MATFTKFANNIPGHYWALFFVIFLILVDALWWGNLRNLFRRRSPSGHSQGRGGSRHDTQQGNKGPFTGPKLILTRTGSMLFDEDDDLAHEFYEERGNQLVRITRGLRKQGLVELPIPAINPSLGVVMQYVKRDGDEGDDTPAASTSTAGTKAASAPVYRAAAQTYKTAPPQQQQPSKTKSSNPKKAKKGKARK